MHPTVVLGGGLAGIACSIRLIDAGERVVLIESRRKLGGRATSFIDPRSGQTLDNCQHVLMGSCTNLLDLYARLGVSDSIQWHPRIWWANPPHDPDEMAPGWLAPPAHFAGAFLKMRFLARKDKSPVARAMWKLIRMGKEGRNKWRGRSFGEFLDLTGQTPRARSHFWEPIIISACNESCASTDAYYAMYVFQQGFLQDSWSPVMGLSRVALSKLYDPAAAIINSAPSSLRMGVSAMGLSFDGKRITGVVTDEGLIEASRVVSTLPPDRLSKLCSESLRTADPRLSRLDEFSYSPILAVHLFFDQAVMRTPHLVLPGRATHWLFDKGVDDAGRIHVHAVISCAREWMDLDEAQIVDRVMADVHWGIPSSIGIRPVAYRAVKEKRATFSCSPGVDALRPATIRDGIRGGVDNLFLAGDWCATGWPATMEGAVRSGYAAAQAITSKGGPIADVPPALFSRLLGL